MMIHRKQHNEVKTCKHFVNNKCDRGNNCWWKHEKGINSDTPTQGFRQAPNNMAPPDTQTKPVIPTRNWPQPNKAKPLNHVQPNQVQTNQVQTNQDQPTITKMMNLMEQNLTVMKNMWNMINKTQMI